MHTRSWKCLFLILLVVTLSLPARAGVITLVNSTPAVFDASSGTRGGSVTGAEPGYGTGVITDINLSVNFAKADGESLNPPYPAGTPFHNEIHFRLTGPLGGWVDLIAAASFNTGSIPFDGTITFDQAAPSVVNYDSELPHAGTYRPTGAGSLSDFNGTSALGAWTLLIEDTNGGDALRYRSMQLDITTAGDGAGAVPEPATMSMLGLGLVALGLLSRRRK